MILELDHLTCEAKKYKFKTIDSCYKIAIYRSEKLLLIFRYAFPPFCARYFIFSPLN